jgi:hypothetical protein
MLGRCLWDSVGDQLNPWEFQRMKRNLQALAALALTAVAGVSQAAVDITAETTAAKTDIASAGAAIIGVVVAIAVIGWVRRVIR